MIRVGTLNNYHRYKYINNNVEIIQPNLGGLDNFQKLFTISVGTLNNYHI